MKYKTRYISNCICMLIGARYRDASALIFVYDQVCSNKSKNQCCLLSFCHVVALFFWMCSECFVCYGSQIAAYSHQRGRYVCWSVPPRIIDVPCLIFSSSCIGAADRVPRVLVANKCDKLASDNDEARVQLEQARAWAQRAGLAFIECSASAPYNVDALFVLVATYLGQIATLPRSVPRWFAPRWGRTTAGKWLAERRIVGSFVVYPWFWRRKQSQHDAACSHSGSAGFELAEIVVGNNNELFVQHKSIAVSRVLPPAGYVDPDPARRSPLVLRFVLAGPKRGFPTHDRASFCATNARLDSYRLTALASAAARPQGPLCGPQRRGRAAAARCRASRRALLSRMGSRTRSRSNSETRQRCGAPRRRRSRAAAGAAAFAGARRAGHVAADAADQPALLEGELRVQTQTVSKKSGWKRRYVSVLRDRLCIYSSEKDRTRRVAPVEMLKLEIATWRSSRRPIDNSSSSRCRVRRRSASFAPSRRTR
jgi:hypothetical protein